MSDTGPSKVEIVKENSRQLRGTLAEELANPELESISEDAATLIKFHGSYQQDDRDVRKEGKAYIFMVRSRIPGGKVTAAQFLSELDLCEKYGNGTLRITDRQGFQLHGVLKGNLKAAIRGINEAKLSTQSACGDVCRNVMCCPAPIKDSPVRQQLQAMCDAVAEFVRPKTTAYYEIWLKDGDQSELVSEFKPVEEPLYGTHYLPRKFKIGFALPEDNCIDVYTQDLGFLAVVEKGTIVGYNVLPGGGMGMTPANKKTFPAIGVRLAFVTPEQVLPVTEAIIKCWRDHGNRSDRKLARIKYLIHDWGFDKFKAKVEEYFGAPLPPPHATDVTEVDDHMGWHEQGDGKLFLGINVENGRIKDEGNLRLKSALRAILGKYPVDTRLTALQGIILCNIEPMWRSDIESMLRSHGVLLAEELSLTRRYSISCPAYPTCGLAVTESERVMPDVMDSIEAEMAKHGLAKDRISVHMTGCPNGCARPYTPDIGLVGKARNKYTMYLGGNAQGTRLGFLFEDMVPQEEIATKLSPVFAQYKAQRKSGEAFGDYCHRVGKEGLALS